MYLSNMLSIISECIFTGNSANVSGGIIFASIGGDIRIEHWEFDNNSGPNGAAIALQTSSSISIIESNFHRNSGGIIINIDNSIVT